MIRLTVIFLLSLISLLTAAPYDGQKYLVKQPDGSKVPVVYYGDEFFVTVESPDGFTLAQNSDGWYTYAKLSADRSEYLPTDHIYTMTSRSIRSSGDKHLRINAESMRKKIDSGREALKQPSIQEVNDRFRERKPIQPSKYLRSASVDTIVGVTILIDFPDQSSDLTKSQIEDFVNKEGYSEFSNNGSIRDYFYDVSNGKWVYLNVVTEFYTTVNNKSYYDHDMSWMEGTNTDAAITRTQEVMYEALDALKADGFDFSQLSTQPSNYFGEEFRAINFFYAGNADNGWGKGLWPHKSALYTRNPGFSADGATAYTYQISNIGKSLRVGTFIHESGHVLCGYPDLYSYESEYKNVIQNYCHMSSSSSTNPITFNPYFRSLMGWLDLTDIDTLTTGREYSASANSSHAYFSHSHNEWFFIENRAKEGRSATLPGEGVMIWRINENGSNSRPSTTGGVRLVEVIQADGRDDMANGGYPDATDFFNASNNSWFSDATNPAALWADGSASGIDIRNISAAGDIMTFTIGEKTEITTYELTVTNGSGDGFYEEGDAVTITAESRPGFAFTQWTGATAYVADSTLSQTTVSMPAEAVALTALYEEIPDTGYTQVINYANWDRVTDDMGSAVAITLGSAADTTVSVQAEISRVAKPDGTEYPYASLAAYAEGSYDNLTKIGITYSSTTAMKLVLPQPTTSVSGAAYYVELPAAEESTTLQFTVDQFTQPGWTESSDVEPLVENSLTGVSFELADESTTAQAGTIAISSLKLYGFSEPAVALKTAKLYSTSQITVSGIQNGQLNFTAPQKGTYQISIYGVNGRRLGRFSTESIYGQNSIDLRAASLAKGIVIVSITGEGFHMKTKSLFR